MPHAEQTLFVLSTHKVPQKHKTDFTKQQVMLLDELNCRLYNFSHDIDGFEDDDHT